MIEKIGTPQHHRARKASAVRHGNTEMAETAGRDLRAAVLAKTIEAAVALDPPFTDTQRLALAGLLVGAFR